MALAPNNIKNLPSLIIITGLSGSGLSSATKAFEDLGYFCVDNLPLTMVSTFAKLIVPNDEGVIAIEKAALVINIRERHFLAGFPVELKKLSRRRITPFVIFFEASTEVLRRRFSETRRPHPADDGVGLLKAIEKEKDELNDIRERADLIIDTSEHTVHTLRRLVIQKFGNTDDGTPLKVQIQSFGHKYGTPLGLDLMFDVRHLPNPYFEESLRQFTGENPKIIDFFGKHGEVEETISRFSELIGYLLPFYKKEGKSYLTIGIGCTGGRHRSVMTANELAKRLASDEFEISTFHRDIEK